MSVPSAKTVNVRAKFVVFLNGKILNHENFPWFNVRGQHGGYDNKHDAEQLARDANDLAKQNFITDRSFSLKKRFFVYFGSLPVGPMYDYGIGPVSGKGKRKKMMQFPDKLRGCPHGFASSEEAEMMKSRFSEYLSDICSVPAEHRSGSAKFLIS